MTEAFDSTKNYVLSPSQAVRVSKVIWNKKGTVIEQSYWAKSDPSGKLPTYPTPMPTLSLNLSLLTLPSYWSTHVINYVQVEFKIWIVFGPGGRQYVEL